MTEPTRTHRMVLTNGRTTPIDLILNDGHATINVRGGGTLTLASAKELLFILEDFIASGDDYEHAEAARAYYEAHPDEVSA
jgi:hypothetical protein